MSDVYVGGAKSSMSMDMRQFLSGLTEGLKGLDDFYVKASQLFNKTDKSAAGMGTGGGAGAGGALSFPSLALARFLACCSPIPKA